MKRGIELLARAVVVRRGRFLTVVGTATGNLYLPGGHVEPGEGLRECLARELREELGARAVVGRYLGSVEHAWTDADGRHFEVNHLFAARVPGLGAFPASRERDLEFQWLSARELSARGLEPAPVRRYLAAWPRVPRGWWASTIERSGRTAGRRSARSTR